MTERTCCYADPSSLNPLIEGQPADTFANVTCALQFLTRVHEELADGHFRAEIGAGPTPMDMNAAEHRGFALLLRVVDAAVRYENGNRAPKGGES